MSGAEGLGYLVGRAVGRFLGFLPRRAPAVRAVRPATEPLTFVFTGALSMRREQARRLVIARGHQVRQQVSRRTDYLVAGKDAGSRLDLALSLGVTVIGEQQFRVMVEGA